MDDNELLLRVTVIGRPAPQGSKNVSASGHVFESSKHLPAWRRTMRQMFAAAHRGRMPFDEPLRLVMTFHMHKPGRPKFKIAPAVMPDGDKLQRAVQDALTDALVIRDDALITDWHGRKRWAEVDRRGNERIGVTIELYRDTVEDEQH